MDEPYRGPVMIAATNMLRPPPARISKITESVVLPRSVTVVSLVAGICGAFLGLLFQFTILLWILPVDLTTFVACVAIGAAAGVFTVTWSPIKGESLFKWMGLNAARLRRDRVEINGKPVRAYIGIAPLHRTAVGRVRVVPSAVEVPPGAVDERGVLLTDLERTMTAVEAAGMGPAGHAPFPSAPGPLWGQHAAFPEEPARPLPKE